MRTCHRVRSVELLVVVSAMLLFASVHRGAWAAPELAPVLAQQSGWADRLVVVDNFLAARNARDAMGATGFTAPLLAIYDEQGQWIRDEPTVRAWLQKLTDMYLIDTLDRPREDGDRVVWVERLTRRGLPYREALASSVEVTVEVVVQGGRITTYSALYPGLASQSSRAGTESMPTTLATDAPGSPGMTLFAAWVGLAAGALIVVHVGQVVWHARHPTRNVRR
jgi:hypothetical protein